MKRLMRMRATQHLRDLCAETEFNRAQLIQPFFVVEGLKSDEPIYGLRGNVRLSISSALRQIESDLKDGVTQFLLFPVPGEKRESDFNHAFERDLISQIESLPVGGYMSVCVHDARPLRSFESERNRSADDVG
jgi:porphobilinogen synthase